MNADDIEEEGKREENSLLEHGDFGVGLGCARLHAYATTWYRAVHVESASSALCCSQTPVS
jgi:hypothetical protein